MSEPKVPEYVGLCPSEHLGEFYVPLVAGESTVCPTCDRHMVVFKRNDALTRAAASQQHGAGDPQ